MIMKIKIMNKIILLASSKRLSQTPEAFDREGKNKAAVHEPIQIIAP